MERTAATDLECRELVELVTDYLEDALPAAERARFEAHLGECEGCRRYVEQIRTTLRLARAAPTETEIANMDALLEAFRRYKRR